MVAPPRQGAFPVRCCVMDAAGPTELKVQLHSEGRVGAENQLPADAGSNTVKMKPLQTARTPAGTRQAFELFALLELELTYELVDARLVGALRHAESKGADGVQISRRWPGKIGAIDYVTAFDAQRQCA